MLISITLPEFALLIVVLVVLVTLLIQKTHALAEAKKREHLREVMEAAEQEIKTQNHLEASSNKSRDTTEVFNELEIARNLQTKLVPTELPQVKGVQLAAKSLPAKEVGGDFYDCFMLREGTLALNIGDVTGKSIPAALLVSMAKFIFRFPPSTYVRPSKLVEVANKLVCVNGGGLFITACFATFDLSEHKFIYVNAGHPPILHYRAKSDEIAYLSATGSMLGVSEESAYREEAVFLAPGDLLLFYSDGLTEVKGEDGKVLGEERLAALFKSLKDLEPEALVEKILDETLEAYQGQNLDDLACLLLKIV